MTFKRYHLYLTVLVGGMTTLAIELSASRLVGNLFGTSNIVWANIIGLMLIYLSAGYFIGGRWADHSPTHVRFYQIAAWGAFLSGLIPFVARFVLPIVAGINLSVGLATAISIFVLFSIPVTLLGCISPFSIRLALQTIEKTGQTVGRIYAISTLGSVIGSLAPVLYLLPEAGTLNTFLIFAGTLLIVALVGLTLHDWRQGLLLGWMPVAHLVFWFLLR